MSAAQKRITFQRLQEVVESNDNFLEALSSVITGKPPVYSHETLVDSEETNFAYIEMIVPALKRLEAVLDEQGLVMFQIDDVDGPFLMTCVALVKTDKDKVYAVSSQFGTRQGREIFRWEFFKEDLHRLLSAYHRERILIWNRIFRQNCPHDSDLNFHMALL